MRKPPKTIFGWHCYVCDRVILCRSFSEVKQYGLSHSMLVHLEWVQVNPFETAWDARLDGQQLVWLLPAQPE